MDPRNGKNSKPARKGDGVVDANVALQVKAETNGGMMVIAGDVKVSSGDRCPSCGGPMKREPAAPAAPTGPTQWRVAKGGTFVQNDSVANVQPGHIVKRSAYGRDGIDRMLKRGIVLEPLD